MKISVRAFGAASALAISVSLSGAYAQEDNEVRSVDQIVVFGDNVYRDRTADINPTLSYDLQFFQRFEPTTVGEMLKRTPGVVFTSDVLEYDAVQLRGIGSQYTQILINGRKVPGQQANGAFFVDRIPAELVERIEIVRAPSVDVTGEGVGGTLNILLKEGADIDGAFVRGGISYFGDGDGKARGSGAAALATSGDGYSFWAGVDVQQRRNPKKKVTEYFDPDLVFDEELEIENDTRDGTDYSFNSALNLDVAGGELEVTGYYVQTNRDENEHVDIFEGPRDDIELVTVETQFEDIKQKSYGFQSVFTLPVDESDLEVSFGYNVFDENTSEFETEYNVEDDELEEDEGSIDIRDRELSGGVAYSSPLSAVLSNKTGVDIRKGRRDGLQLGDTADVEADIETFRVGAYTKFEYEFSPAVLMETGVRYEYYERDVLSDGVGGSKSDGKWLPSAHLRWDLTPDDRIRLSAARTIRFPDFDLISPFEEDETPGDDDILTGNPNLDVETAWGVDLGYERRIGSKGIVGLNVFYRDFSDLIELVPVAANGSGSYFMPMNIGDGKAWGVEFDLSTPLDMFGLPETALYANAAYLDSEVTDFNTGMERKFTNQPDFVYNVSLIQNFPAWGGAIGASYQKRDASLEYGFDEIVETSYDGNLEAFAEKRFGERVVLRFSANNLLDAHKLEFIEAYDGDSAAEFAEAIITGDVDGIEIQDEQSSRVYSLTLRLAF